MGIFDFKELLFDFGWWSYNCHSIFILDIVWNGCLLRYGTFIGVGILGVILTIAISFSLKVVGYI